MTNVKPKALPNKSRISSKKMAFRHQKSRCFSALTGSPGFWRRRSPIAVFRISYAELSNSSIVPRSSKRCLPCERRQNQRTVPRTCPVMCVKCWNLWDTPKKRPSPLELYAKNGSLLPRSSQWLIIWKLSASKTSLKRRPQGLRFRIGLPYTMSLQRLRTVLPPRMLPSWKASR